MLMIICSCISSVIQKSLLYVWHNFSVLLYLIMLFTLQVLPPKLKDGCFSVIASSLQFSHHRWSVCLVCLCLSDENCWWVSYRICWLFPLIADVLQWVQMRHPPLLLMFLLVAPTFSCQVCTPTHTFTWLAKWGHTVPYCSLLLYSCNANCNKFYSLG